MESMFHKIKRKQDNKTIQKPKSTINFNFSLILKILVILFSFIAFLHEAGELVSLYYKYPTVVNVKLEKEMIIELPSVTLCAPMILTKSSILAKYRNQIEEEIAKIGTPSQKGREKIEFEKSKVFQKYRDLALREIQIVNLFNLSISSLSFVTCDLSLPTLKDPTRGSCDHVANVIESFNANGKCFTYFSQLNQETIDPLQYKVSLYQGLRSSIGGIATIDINFPLEEYTNYWDIDMATIYIHPPNLVPSFEKIHRLKPGVKYDIYFSKTLSKLLPPPYETRCKTYQLKDPNRPQSRVDCVDKCIIKIWKTLCNCTPSHISIRKEVEHNGYLCIDQTVNHSVAGEMKSACYDECLPDCIDEEYNFEVEETVYPSERDIEKALSALKPSLIEKKKRHANINLIRKFSGDVTYTHTPQMPFIEFICYIGSLASLWLGISVLAIFDALAKVCKFFYFIKHNHECIIMENKQNNKVEPENNLELKRAYGNNIIII